MEAEPLLSLAETMELTGRSERWVRDRAERAERGQYKLTSLAPAAQQAWAEGQKRKVIELVPAAKTAPGQLALALTVPVGPNLSAGDREEAERRYRVIEPLVTPEKCQAIWQAHGNRKGDLVAWLAEQHQTAPRTIYHWLKAWNNGGLPSLASKVRTDKGRPRSFNSASLDFILAAALPKRGGYGTLSVREIYRAYEEERAWRTSHARARLREFELRKYSRYLIDDDRLHDDAQLPAASYETFRAWVAKIPEVVKVMAREGEEAFHNTQEIISFRALADIKPLDYVVMDHRRLDLFCLVKAGQGWKVARPWLTAAIDMRTRKWLSWAVVETPSSDSIACVLKRTFLDHGIPQSVYWDNGKDFRCEWLEGGQRRESNAPAPRELAPAWRGVMETLGVRVHHAIVKRARSKIIEPCFIGTANFDKTLPEYCGHKPDARPDALEKMIAQHEKWLTGQEACPTPFRTIEQIAGLYAELLDTLNEREHPGEGMAKITPTGRGWMCPNEAWEAGIGKVDVRRAPAEVLQFCFAKRRTIKVLHSEVCASFHGRKYHYRVAGDSAALALYNGREIEFAYDPQDLETAALYCDGRFLGLVSNVELRRMGEEGFVQDERDRRAMRRGVKDLVERIHQAVHIPAAEERAERRAAVRPEKPLADARGSVFSGPPAIAAAVEAAREDRNFRFADAGVDLVRAADNESYRDDKPDDDGAFDFFGGGPNERSA